MIHRTVGIIGAGPSGITAGIQLTRYGISTILIEGKHPGGLLRNANWVENYPGFPTGISGEDLADLMTRQIEGMGVEMITDVIQSIRWDGEVFILDSAKNQISCNLLILASGTKPIQLPENVVHHSAKAAVFYEVTQMPCSHPAKIAIIGGGDAAFDYALHLCPHHQVTIYYRGAKARCLPLLWQRAVIAPTIQITPFTQVESIHRSGNGRLELALHHRGENHTQQVDFVLVAIGRQPALDFLSPALLQQMHELERKGRCFRIGDVHNGFFRQTAIAVGDGMRAAMQIAQSLQELTL
ncbi:MAG: NAD(P)/FAD-dependent oxidoreductase [Anaerolineales bacterium]